MPKVYLARLGILFNKTKDIGKQTFYLCIIQANQTSLGSISMDDCLGLTSAECETNEPFSIGIKTTAKTFYMKAENRLEMDNWCRVLKPFVIASPGYNFNKKSPTTRTISQVDSKTAAATSKFLLFTIFVCELIKKISQTWWFSVGSILQ
jgi:hypothetical protein